MMRRLIVIFCSAFILLSKIPLQALQIYVFGDSHCFAFEKIERCKLVHLGPVTMHRVGRDGLRCLDLRKQGIKKGDAAVFTFGEIDVRCHILKQVELYHRDLEEVLDFLTKKYIETVLENAVFYPGCFFFIASVVPPTDAQFSPDYPYFGSLNDRVSVTKKLNQKLLVLCSKYGLHFLNIYDRYANEDGTLNGLLSDGNVHISRDHYGAIREELFRGLQNARTNF